MNQEIDRIVKGIEAVVQLLIAWTRQPLTQNCHFGKKSQKTNSEVRTSCRPPTRACLALPRPRCGMPPFSRTSPPASPKSTRPIPGPGISALKRRRISPGHVRRVSGRKGLVAVPGIPGKPLMGLLMPEPRGRGRAWGALLGGARGGSEGSGGRRSKGLKDPR